MAYYSSQSEADKARSKDIMSSWNPANTMRGIRGFFGSYDVRDPYGTLNPEQKALTQSLGPYFQNVLNAGPSSMTYQGQLTEPITQPELNSISNFNRLDALRNTGLEALLNPDINAYNKRFDEGVYNPQLNQFRSNILPGIQEEYRSFGTPIADVTNKAYTDMNDTLAGLRYTGYENQLNRILTASGALNEASKTAMAINAIPREIKNTEFGMRLANFYKGQESYQNSINQMLNFLGISTGTVEQDSSFQNMIAALLGIGKIAAGFGSGSAGTAGASASTPTASSPNLTSWA